MNRLESMQSCYDDIMALKGADEMKKKIKQIHEILKDREPYALLNSLSDFLIVTRQGGGISTVVKLVAEYLSVAKAVEFCGNTKWFSFSVEYSDRNQQFTEIERFMNKMSVLKGYNCFFKGVVYINLDNWVGHTDPENLYKFLSYLASIDDRILFFFGFHTENKSFIKMMETTIGKYIRIETIKLRFPSNKDLCDILKAYITDKGISLSDDVQIPMDTIIENVTNKRNFYGFQTLEKLSDDIVYHFFMTNKTKIKQINGKVLNDYLEKSPYFKQFTDDISSNTKIGFTK